MTTENTNQDTWHGPVQKANNPQVVALLRSCLSMMGESEAVPTTPAFLSDLHLAFGLAWHTGDRTTDGETGRMLIPATTEQGEPRLFIVENLGDGTVRTLIESYPNADEDLTTAAFNLIVGF